MSLCSTTSTPAVPRRVFLIMPIALAGLAVLAFRRERPLPDAARDGGGAKIALVLFADSGEQVGTVEVGKVVKSDGEWRRELAADEFAVTRRQGTERAYTGLYWNRHEAGLYRCVCCGSGVFRSREKFDSGTGWPSFWAPAAAENVRTQSDSSLGMARVEAVCSKCDAHLGHVFEDGPPPTGLRYCINSAALRLVT
jgi:peptide-methionine (R)-S-oxide reductase